VAEWIVVCNWEKYQQRADRFLPWFKVYYVLSRHDEWRSLSLSARGLLVSIWLEYGPSKGRIRLSDITHRTGQRVRRETVDSLVAAGFIEIRATQPPEVADTQSSRARAREVEVNEDPPTPHRGARPKPRKPKVTGWRLVRGSHGQTHIPDPKGTDRPPPEVRT
jgi:hypothetical protein